MTDVAPALLAKHAFLHGLPAPQVAALARATRQIWVPAGHRFFEEGGRAGQLWLITAGHVALDIQVPGRARLIVETIGEGDVMGLSWVSAPQEWQFGAEAIQPTTAFELDTAALTALCESDPVLGYQITRRLIAVAVRRLQATRIRLLDLYSAPSQNPVAP